MIHHPFDDLDQHVEDGPVLRWPLLAALLMTIGFWAVMAWWLLS